MATFQTSTNHGGAASRAVDGNTASNYDAGSCTHTTDHPGEANPTWWVDLGQSHVIGRVVIFNRQDCCAERINPFNIHIGDSDQVSTNPKCGGDHQIDVNQPSISVSCPGMRGRYVSVRLPGLFRTLTLCEVQLFSESIECQMGSGASYRGRVSVTETGKTCQRWDSQTPHGHSYTSPGLEENYCRETDDSTGVWCYTMDPYTRWDWCDVPACVFNHKRDADSGCQDGYIRLGKTCFRLVLIQKSFWDAQNACGAEGATLAMPKTKEMDIALKRLIKTSGGDSDYWIGLRETDSYGGWKWVDESLLGNHHGWHPGEPSDFRWLWGALCVQYWYSEPTTAHMWDDVTCSDNNRYICQSFPEK
ncbi:uncharacterized protein [Branchiostoma lanceolatum]|uniref:uncharacterized protein n=1 Tax=Branchiostoma lanceolatum TaxID=7740 RepID=UPI003456C3B2